MHAVVHAHAASQWAQELVITRALRTLFWHITSVLRSSFPQAFVPNFARERQAKASVLSRASFPPQAALPGNPLQAVAARGVAQMSAGSGDDWESALAALPDIGSDSGDGETTGWDDALAEIGGESSGDFGTDLSSEAEPGPLEADRSVSCSGTRRCTSLALMKQTKPPNSTWCPGAPA